MEDFIIYAGWVGAVSLIFAGLIIDKLVGKFLQIGGIVCLSVQALYLGQDNLIFLNVATIFTFTVSLVTQLRASRTKAVFGQRHRVFCSRELAFDTSNRGWE